MGIDAEILVRRVPPGIVTDEWLKEISWKLCRAIGAKHFFTSDGLPPDEYAAANEAWQAAFKAHALHDQWDAAYKKSSDWSGHSEDRAAYDALRRELHAKIFADIGEPPKERRMAIDRTLTRYREDNDPPPGSEYREDSDRPIRAERNECLLELSLFGRYYGPGYERGDILTYCAIAEWLEVNIPGCEVWYGGDSSGVLAELFDDKKRAELRRHLYSEQGRDYYKSWGNRTEYGTPPACSLCPGGEYRGERFGTGQGYASFHCAGCGKSMQTRDRGCTWTEEKERD
jgi:hypothetical protein